MRLLLILVIVTVAHSFESISLATPKETTQETSTTLATSSVSLARAFDELDREQRLSAFDDGSSTCPDLGPTCVCYENGDGENIIDCKVIGITISFNISPCSDPGELSLSVASIPIATIISGEEKEIPIPGLTYFGIGLYLVISSEGKHFEAIRGEIDGCAFKKCVSDLFPEEFPIQLFKADLGLNKQCPSYTTYYIIACVVGAALLLICIFCCCRCCRKKRLDTTTISTYTTTMIPIAAGINSTIVATPVQNGTYVPPEVDV